MKMHLVLPALAALCSHAAFAASEGGDTWSETQPQPRSTSAYGTPARPDSADRVVRLGPDSHWINVAYGETVKFIVTGENGSERSFAWRFDVSPVLRHVDLRDVAPADLPSRNLRVFVAPDSRYRGG
jgi:hypothetical protein